MSISKMQAGNDAIYITEYGIPIRNLWHMLLYAWNDYSIQDQIAWSDLEESPTLDALLATILIKLVQQRLRIGLARDYVHEKGMIKAIRGRINFPESLKRNSFEQGQAFCEFGQYSWNIPKNQIIRSILMNLSQTGNFGPNQFPADELRHKLRLLTRSLEGIDLIEPRLELIRRQQFVENDVDYSLMLGICELIVQSQMPMDSNGISRLPKLDRDELTLHLIYEKFVANFYRLHLKGWSVTAQKHLTWHEKSPNDLPPIMKPDLVLEEKSTSRVLILDTKFTQKSLIENQWGKKEFDSSHLYQLYAYLKTQEHLSEGHRQAAGILLYPATGKLALSETIQIQDMSIRIESVDLTAPWQDIEKRLLDLAETS